MPNDLTLADDKDLGLYLKPLLGRVENRTAAGRLQIISNGRSRSVRFSQDNYVNPVGFYEPAKASA